MITTSKDDTSGKPKLQVRFIDFDLSKVLLVGEKCQDRSGTLVYLSPEVVLNMSHSHLTDVWSLGVVLHILLSGIVPFLSMDKTDLMRNIVRGQLHLGHPSFAGVSSAAKDLLKRMLCEDPKGRISAKEIASHPWFTL